MLCLSWANNAILQLSFFLPTPGASLVYSEHLNQIFVVFSVSQHCFERNIRKNHYLYLCIVGMTTKRFPCNNGLIYVAVLLIKWLLIFGISEVNDGNTHNGAFKGEGAFLEKVCDSNCCSL